MALSVSVVGTGNLASHFIPALLSSSSFNLRQVLGRNEEQALKILGDYGHMYIPRASDLDKDIDYIFLMVNDASIPVVSYLLSSVLTKRTCVVHFSGVADLAVIDSYFKRRACAWPVGSISEMDQKLDLSLIPLCISGSTPNLIKELSRAFIKTFPIIHVVPQEDKSTLHLGAVIANNFTNHLYHLSELLLKQKGLDPSILKPIILQTAQKVSQGIAAPMQTGPAVRGDDETMEMHMQLLEDNESMQHIYEILSSSIAKLNSK